MTESANSRFTVEHDAARSRYVLVDSGDNGSNDSGSDGAGDPGGTGGRREIGLESYVDVEPGGSSGADDSGNSRPERVMHHTEVDPEYGGQGLASVLVRFAVEHAIAAGFAVVPVCPYVANWLKKHDEFSDHVVQHEARHIRAVRARMN